MSLWKFMPCQISGDSMIFIDSCAYCHDVERYALFPSMESDM